MMNLWNRLSSGRGQGRQSLPTIEEAADDGEQMALQAALMAIKNRILIEAITTTQTVRSEKFLTVAGEIIRELIEECHSEQVRIARTLEAAKKKRGLADSGTDYRRGDTANLRLRLNAGIEVEKRLVSLASDSTALLRLIERAHERAWDEISCEMERSLNRRVALHRKDAKYVAERESRVRALIDNDLAQLIAGQTTEG